MNNLMKDGKKSVAEKIVYGAFDQITKTSKEAAARSIYEGIRRGKSSC
jgi:ribosomal protein S7